jgi:hypothetical protein
LKIVKANKVLTSEALNAEMIVNENIRKANEDARNVYEEYNPIKQYIKGNKVAYNGSSYLNKVACTGIIPTNTTYWLCIASAGAGLTDASQLPITDTGNYYTTDNTGAVLQEVGQRIGNLSLLQTESNTDLVGAINENVIILNDYIRYKTIAMSNVKMFKCLDGEYVKGDGIHDDTTGIQLAMDTANGALLFPPGTYKVTGTGEACLYLTHNIDILGFSKRYSTIRADGVSASTSIFKICFNDNSGFTDVRNWKIENISMFFNGGGGKHGILIKDAMSMLTCQITNCGLSCNHVNGGYAIYVIDNFAHGVISNNTIEGGIYMKCYDANLITKNMFFGIPCAITFDCIYGVHNNTVEANTIVNRDGAVHIVNGNAIRIINNQIELGAGNGNSESPVSAFIWVEGATLECENTIIENNNFGGGTALNYSVVIDKAYKTVFSKNRVVATNTADILLNANARYSVIKKDNTVIGSETNPRTDTFYKLKVTDNGIGSVNTHKLAATLNLQNGWINASYHKDENGMVVFDYGFDAGTQATGTLIGTLPVGFRGMDWYSVPCITSSGIGYLNLDASGNIKVGSIPSNVNVMPLPFMAKITD